MGDRFHYERRPFLIIVHPSTPIRRHNGINVKNFTKHSQDLRVFLIVWPETIAAKIFLWYNCNRLKINYKVIPMQKSGNKLSFIDFLSEQFKISSEKNNTIRQKENNFLSGEILSSQKDKKIPTKDRLAHADKLIKTVEIFLASDDSSLDIDEKLIKDWDDKYKTMKLNIVNDVDEYVKRKRAGIKKKQKEHRPVLLKQNIRYAIIREKLEYVPSGNTLNYAVAIVSLFILSIISVLTFPSFTNNSLVILDKIITHPFENLYNDKNIAPDSRFANEKKSKILPTKNLLSEYIKKNSANLNEDKIIKEEEIWGQVAGIEEIE